MHKKFETGSITDLASEGQGIIRKEGFVIFIPFTAKGDFIQYSMQQKKKNFAIGKLINVLDPSIERTTPPCPYYGICGGCQLQHINYEAQLEYKRKWIEDALKKIGGFKDVSLSPVRPANLRWNYRRRVSLILKWHKEGFKAGYIATDNKSFVEIENCLIFTDERDSIFKVIQKICSEFKSNDNLDGKVAILKNDQGFIIHYHFKNMPKNAFEILSNAFKTHSFLTGILATSQKQTLRFGAIETSFEIAPLSFDFTPQTFIQNHPEQSLNIYKEIQLIANELKPKKILDLYCGIGISSLLLAKEGYSVQGVELNMQAVKLAKSNAAKNGLLNVQFIDADVEKILLQLLEGHQPDLILVNPPREGLSEGVVQLLQSNPVKNLIYVSCMPSTLARDLKILCENHYELVSVNAFDMFPQTVHVETLVLLQAR